MRAARDVSNEVPVECLSESATAMHGESRPATIVIEENGFVRVGKESFHVRAGQVIEDPIVVAYVIGDGSVVYTDAAAKKPVGG